MDYTTNLNLKKPSGGVDGDFVDIADINGNMDDIDAAVGDHIADIKKHAQCAVTTGSANAYAVTLSPAPTEYTNFMDLALQFNVANTGPITINVNGLGDKSVADLAGQSLLSGALSTSRIYTLRYSTEGSCFYLQNSFHPASHAPSIITQDSSNRFVTDAEKSAFNGAATAGNIYNYKNLGGSL